MNKDFLISSLMKWIKVIIFISSTACLHIASVIQQKDLKQWLAECSVDMDKVKCIYLHHWEVWIQKISRGWGHWEDFICLFQGLFFITFQINLMQVRVKKNGHLRKPRISDLHRSSRTLTSKRIWKTEGGPEFLGTPKFTDDSTHKLVLNNTHLIECCYMESLV